MSYFEDVFSIPKPKEGKPRGEVSLKAAQASLDRGLKQMGVVCGFEIGVDDPRFSVQATRREGSKAIVTYGMRGRKIDARQLAYELNN